MYIIAVLKKEHLIAHFYERARYSQRNAEKYVKHVDRIMRIQEYLVERAREHGIPVIENVELESTVSTILADMMKKLEEKGV